MPRGLELDARAESSFRECIFDESPPESRRKTDDFVHETCE